MDKSFVNLLPDKEGCIKVRLTYLTEEPKHIRSIMLHNTFAAKPPYFEDVCVLIPCPLANTTIQTYLPYLKRLQDNDVISPTAKLTHFAFLDEDVTTLAYLV